MSSPASSGRVEPLRTCVGCRRRAPQRELVRLVLDEEGIPVIGRTLPGRGAWLCAESLDACRALAERRGSLARAFRRRSG